MVCRPGQACFPDLTGKVIRGRSVPGYDYNTSPTALGSGAMRSGNVSYDGEATYYPQQFNNDSMNFRNMRPNNVVGARVSSFTDTPWYTQPVFIFIFGFIAGFIFGSFVLTPGGRQLTGATSERMARRIREGKQKKKKS